jgi:hypothetical protein
MILAGELVLGDQPARLPLHHLQVVVDEPDGPGPERRDEGDDHEPVGEGAQSSVGTTVQSRMMMPPIVGVPRLPWWLARKSTRTTCPILSARSFRMIAGPTKNASSSAVTTAPGRPEADVVEQIEKQMTLAHRGEEVVEHQASEAGGMARLVTAGSIRSSATPRDALRITSSSPCSRSASFDARPERPPR